MGCGPFMLQLRNDVIQMKDVDGNYKLYVHELMKSRSCHGFLLHCYPKKKNDTFCDVNDLNEVKIRSIAEVKKIARVEG